MRILGVIGTLPFMVLIQTNTLEWVSMTRCATAVVENSVPRPRQSRRPHSRHIQSVLPATHTMKLSPSHSGSVIGSAYALPSSSTASGRFE